MQRLNFSESYEAFLTSIPHYLGLLRQNYKELLILFLCLYGPFVLGGLTPYLFSLGVGSWLPILDGILWLIGSITWLLAAYVFLEFLVNKQLGGETQPKNVLQSFSFQNIWDYMLVVSFAQIIVIIGVAVLCFVVILGLFNLSPMLVSVFGKTSFSSILFAPIIIAVPVMLVVALGVMVSFTAHHFYFQRQVSLQPVRASINFVVNRWGVILLGCLLMWVCSCLISVVFLIPGVIERLINVGHILNSSQQEWLKILQDVYTQFARGKFDMKSVQLLLPLLKGMSNASITQTLSSALSAFISMTFWCHQFLYFMSFYHQDRWQYPEEFLIK